MRNIENIGDRNVEEFVTEMRSRGYVYRSNKCDLRAGIHVFGYEDHDYECRWFSKTGFLREKLPGKRSMKLVSAGLMDHDEVLKILTQDRAIRICCRKERVTVAFDLANRTEQFDSVQEQFSKLVKLKSTPESLVAVLFKLEHTQIAVALEIVSDELLAQIVETLELLKGSSQSRYDSEVYDIVKRIQILRRL
jgi:hypothetical protein